eukprot:g3064.t1
MAAAVAGRPLIAVTNDDGVGAPGIGAVVSELAAWADVIVIAPRHNQSATSYAITLERTMKLDTDAKLHEEAARKMDAAGTLEATKVMSFDGTPVDCVLMLKHLLLKSKLERIPDFLVSGINQGSNVAGDILVSGTVSAAMFASMRIGIPSVAASFNSFTMKKFSDFAQAATFVSGFCKTQRKHFKERCVLNINCPSPAPTENQDKFRWTTLGSCTYDGKGKMFDEVENGTFKLAGVPHMSTDPGTDTKAMVDGVNSVTPLVAGSSVAVAPRALVPEAAVEYGDDLHTSVEALLS